MTEQQENRELFEIWWKELEYDVKLNNYSKILTRRIKENMFKAYLAGQGKKSNAVSSCFCFGNGLGMY